MKKIYKLIRYIELKHTEPYLLKDMTLKEAKIEKKKEKKLHPENIYRIKRIK